MTLLNRRVIWSSLLSILLFGCDEPRTTEPYEYTELAMVPGMVIEAENKYGTIRIDAISKLGRRYQWDGFDETRILIPRKERFMGELGAYDPAPSPTWEFWYQRIVARDSILDFSSMEDMKARLNQGRAVMDWVYRDDGLVVGFGRAPDRRQINVDVFQFYINGKKPTVIEGSRPEQMRVTYAEGE
jgi:hypothetical protein